MQQILLLEKEKPSCPAGSIQFAFRAIGPFPHPVWQSSLIWLSTTANERRSTGMPCPLSESLPPACQGCRSNAGAKPTRSFFRGPKRIRLLHVCRTELLEEDLAHILAVKSNVLASGESYLVPYFLLRAVPLPSTLCCCHRMEDSPSPAESAAALEKKKQPRTSRPKVKTGCITCK